MANYLNSGNFPANVNALKSGFINMFAPARPWVSTMWNASPYTGSGIVPNGSNQLGYQDLNGGNGSSTIQSAPGKVGLFLNGFSTETHTSPHYVGQWCFGVQDKSYAGNDRPWANGKWLHAAARIRVHSQYFGNACGYSYMVLILHDLKSKISVQLLYALTDSRSNIGSGAWAAVSQEAGGTIAFAQVGVTNGEAANGYLENWGANYRRGSGNSVDDFWFAIGPQHLQKLLDKARTNPGCAGLSTDSGDYVLEGVAFQPELGNLSGQPTNIPGQFGWTLESCNVVSQ